MAITRIRFGGRESRSVNMCSECSDLDHLGPDCEWIGANVDFCRRPLYKKSLFGSMLVAIPMSSTICFHSFITCQDENSFGRPTDVTKTCKSRTVEPCVTKLAMKRQRIDQKQADIPPPDKHRLNNKNL